MQEFPSTDAKDKWGTISDAALQAPVTITKHGRPTLIITSISDYEDLQQLKYERLQEDVMAGFEQLERGEFSDKSIEDIKIEARKRFEKSRV